MTGGAAQAYLVSAIVSTYNAQRHIAAKLADLEAQSIADRLEIIVIDSGSKENEGAVVAEFQKRYRNIRYLRTERRETVYQAWNRGIRLASGTFITNANTDDRLAPNALEVLAGALQANPQAVLAYPDMYLTEREGESFDCRTPFLSREWPDFSRGALLEECCIGPFPLWRRSLHDAIGYFDERFKSAADYDFWLRAALEHPFIHVAQCLGLYYLGPTVSRKGHLPTLEYLQVQKIYREKYARFTPDPPQLPAHAAQEYRQLMLLAQQQPDAALPQLEGFVARHGSWPRAHHDLAELYYRAKEVSPARKHFEKAVLLDPKEPLYAEKLYAFLRLELFDSLQYFNELALQEPGDTETLLTLGMICQFMERFDAARGHYQKILEQDPENALARGNLAALSEPSPEDMRLPPASDASATGYYGHSRREVQHLVRRNARTVLDVGCAAGALGHGLKKRQGAEVWGVETQPEAAARAARLLDRVLAAPVEESLGQLPDSYFDTVVCADVLEHLADPEGVLRALRGKLSPTGELVLSLPNVRHWSVVKGLLEGSWEYQDAGILDRSHLRFFTRTGAVALLENAGYSVCGVQGVRLGGDSGVPAGLAATLAAHGVDSATLEEEGGVYQYLISAVPAGRLLASIIIPTFNEIGCTRQCLQSIEKHTPQAHEVIFVDNGSSDGTVEWLRELCRENARYRLLENGTNLGFAAACNRGMAAAAGSYLMLLNNDTVVTEGWLSGMLAHFERDRGIALVGPMTNECGGPQRVVNPRYASLEELDAFARSFRTAHLDRRIETDRLVGFCLLFPRTLLETLKGFDTAFGNGNFEDDDLCLRALLAGYRCVIAGDVFIHHYGSRTFLANGIDHAAAMAANREVFNKKWDLTGLEESLAKRLVTHNAMVRAERLARQGRLSEAVDLLLQEGIRFSPENPAPYRLLAQLLAGHGRQGDALEVLERMPAGAELCRALLEARCHLERGETEAARRAVDVALSLEGECAAALHLQAELAAQAGDDALAQSLLARAVSADPGYAPCYRLLARLYGRKGARDKALLLAERAYLLAPQDMESLALYHEAASASGSVAAEEERVREALALFPLHRGIHFALIDLLLVQGNAPAAMAEIERAALAFGVDDGMLDAALSVRRRVGPRLPQPGRRPSVSLCMIVKDEAQHLPRVLSSVTPLVDEMVVVDTGSADRSADIAAVFGARVFRFPWTGSFADARNYSLAHASGDWILVLDADEALSLRDLEALRALLSGERAGYLMTTRNYTDSVARRRWSANSGAYPQEEAGCGWTPSEKVRLFPRHPEVRFEGVVHELVEDSLLRVGMPILPCPVPVPVHHYGRLDTARELQKRQHYYQLGMRKLSQEGGDIKALIELAVQATELELFAEAQQLWERVLAPEPKNCAAFFNLGYIHLSTGNYPEALRCSRRALELDPQLKEAAYNAAKAELYLGLAAQALQSAQEILSGCPGYPPAVALSATALLLQHRVPEAEELLAELQRRRFDCGDFLREHAAGLQKGGKAAQAAILVRTALELSGADADAASAGAAAAGVGA